MLNKKDLIELISVTRQHINLNDAVIEKDYYVTQVIHAISDVENEYFRLVFCGGTCLAKAHRSADRINANFFTLAKAIVTNDAKQFKNQHPEYSTDPGAEIKQSLALLKNKPLWKERYQEFIETMVYDNTTTIEYKNAINILENISTKVIDSLHQ